MKPADYYVGSRQFFGYLLPGLLWLVTWEWIWAADPVQVFIDASWQRWLIFLLVSYVIGHIMQSLLFHFFTQESERHDLIFKLKDIIVSSNSNPWLWNAAMEESEATPLQEREPKIDLAKFCKTVVIEDTEKLALEVQEREADLNFLKGASPALVALGIAISGRLVFGRGRPNLEIPLLAGFLFVSGVTLFFHSIRVRQWERKAWFLHFAVWAFLKAHLATQGSARSVSHSPSAVTPEGSSDEVDQPP
jgi:hypothetical protein